MRWLGLAFVVAALLLGWAAYANPALFPGTIGEPLPRMIYLILALLLVTGAGLGFAGRRADRGRILPALAFWAGAILLIVFLYNLFQGRA